eukprot:3918281-Amphidinium_carterae.1
MEGLKLDQKDDRNQTQKFEALLTVHSSANSDWFLISGTAAITLATSAASRQETSPRTEQSGPDPARRNN